MLPPVDDAILHDNPNFAELHKTLTTVILTPSGATKVYVDQKQRDSTAKVGVGSLDRLSMS